MVRTSRVVPKEWAKYSPLGYVIPRTRFIVFKTPLNERLNNRIPEGTEFTVNHLFRMLAERNQRLGLVVDLTDTNRYYDKRDIEGMCIEYEKLYCPGRGFVERDDVVDNFNGAIQRFIEKNDDPDALIGIHCTRGVNRSGYLVCRFLIDCLSWSSHEAIDAFEKARGYPIEKGAYIAALHRAAKENRDKPRREVRESDSGESEEEGRKKKKRRRREGGDMRIGGNGAEMGDMIKQFLGVLGQEASQLGVDSPPPTSFDSMMWNGRNESNTNSPLVVGDDDGDDDEIDKWNEEGGVVQGGIVDGYIPPEDESTAQKRRARRKKLEKMFNVMKRGKFHEIQALQREKYGTS